MHALLFLSSVSVPESISVVTTLKPCPPSLRKPTITHRKTPKINRVMSKESIKLSLRGPALLNNPTWNKGSAFTHEERKEFGLRGRLPYAQVPLLFACGRSLWCSVDTLDEQVERAYMQYQSRESDLLKNSFLQSLKGRLATQSATYVPC
jgi:hypothetical protein